MRLKDCTFEPERKKSFILCKQSTLDNYVSLHKSKSKKIYIYIYLRVSSKVLFVLVFIGKSHTLFGLSWWLRNKKICLPVQDMQETGIWSLGGEDPLENWVATYSHFLAWKISWTQEPGGLQSLGWQSGTWLSDWGHTS